jgi:hypothetical protein
VHFRWSSRFFVDVCTTVVAAFLSYSCVRPFSYFVAIDFGGQVPDDEFVRVQLDGPACANSIAGPSMLLAPPATGPVVSRCGDGVVVCVGE